MESELFLKAAALAAASGVILAASAALAQAARAGASDTTADVKQAVTRVLSSYEAALNASDTNAVMPLYAEDGVFMPQHSQSAVGSAAVRQAYDAVFQAIRLNVKFNIAELVVMSPEWAFARTNSAGTVKVHATGATSAEANQELFIFRKGNDGSWKIARYCFSTTNPPRQ
jgi:uncharacterized protein (TIGR02246 family)